MDVFIKGRQKRLRRVSSLGRFDARVAQITAEGHVDAAAHHRLSLAHVWLGPSHRVP
jgi:hypothetical protein